VVGGRTPGRLVLSRRDGTIRIAAIENSITREFEAINFFARIIRSTSITSVIATAMTITLHMFPRASQNSVTNTAPAIAIKIPSRQANSRLRTIISTSISASRQKIESGSRINCVE